MTISAESLLTNLSQLLSEHLGQFADGSQAIVVEPPRSEITGTGIHIYIDRFSRDSSADKCFYRVTVIQYDLAGVEAFEEVLKTIRWNYPQYREYIPEYRKGLPLQAYFELEFYKTSTNFV